MRRQLYSCYSGKQIMQKIEAVIQPSKLDALKDALLAIGVEGMTILEARGQGAKRVTPSSIADASIRLIFCPRSRSKPWFRTSCWRRLFRPSSRRQEQERSGTAKSLSPGSMKPSVSATATAARLRFKRNGLRAVACLTGNKGFGWPWPDFLRRLVALIHCMRLSL